MVKNPNWQEVSGLVGYLQACVAIELNSGLLLKTPCKLVVRMGLEPVTESTMSEFISSLSV